MIIVCSGPDTYRAREKARELMSAFKQKHDPGSLSTFINTDGQDVKTIFSNIGTPSLFTNKKLIRSDGILKTLKIAEVRMLVSKLQIDGDQTVFLTVEDEPPSDKIMETLKPAPLFHYSFSVLKTFDFLKWVKQEAQKLGVSEKIAIEIADCADGDSWFVKQELIKHAAYSEAVSVNNKGTNLTVFGVIEDFLLEKKGSRQKLLNLKDESAVILMLNQIRSFIRVRDGFSDGVHPFVVKKMKQMKIKEVETRLVKSIKALRASRIGLASGNEIESLI
ncbi:MAG: hypothetical protein ABIB04_00250 [Patescibacteria group bacterium]